MTHLNLIIDIFTNKFGKMKVNEIKFNCDIYV